MSPAPNTSKQPPIWKEIVAVICMMLFLAGVGFGLAYYKGHTVWQPDTEAHEEY